LGSLALPRLFELKSVFAAGEKREKRKKREKGRERDGGREERKEESAKLYFTKP